MPACGLSGKKISSVCFVQKKALEIVHANRWVQENQGDKDFEEGEKVCSCIPPLPWKPESTLHLQVVAHQENEDQDPPL